MDNSFLVGLSAQRVLRQRMDMTANNLANMTTTGFKAEHLVMREISDNRIEASDLPHDVNFVDGWMLQRDFSTGPIQPTGNPLDVAIEGEGFFVVETDGGIAYTRDGAFALNDQGQLVTRAGDIVLGDGGPIQIDPEAGAISITSDGSIQQGTAEVGRFRVEAFDNPGALEKVGANLLRATDEEPRDPENSRLVGGFLENSNVNPVLELTRMIEISRAYQSISQVISNSDELRAASINKLSKVG